MIKKLDEKVRKYYKNLDTRLGYAVPSETVFRLLGNSNFNFKNKKILDIGFGIGDNLLEFQRRGGIIFGIDIRKKILQLFIKKNKQNPKNYFHCDLNKNFPKINKKIDLVLCKDTIYYLKPERQFVIFDNVNKILKKNGFFLFQYIQTQLKQNSKNFFSFNLSKKSLFHNMNCFMNKQNPLPFLKNQHIKKLLENKHFKIKKNIFDINIHTKNKKAVYTINRFILLQKI
jgi:2-polyprenyl-3-methyl-5-hydroxy-6-metoxy-1,4-benzoquinol methylase